MNPKGLILVAILISILASPLVLVTQSTTVGIHQDFPHARVVVTRVVDGDTIHISPPVCVMGDYRYVVRLADIDAPELTTPEGVVSRDKLIELLAQYNNIVYLDIANYNRQAGCASGLVDAHGRVIAVVYVRINSTHILNVNKWMVDNGYANLVDLADNDFDPTKWPSTPMYSIDAEKLPQITRIPICVGCDIAYNTTWGIRAATSPCGSYLLVTYSIFTDWRLRYALVDSNGTVVRSGFVDGTNLHVGYSYIATNESGFFVTYRDHVVGPHRARFVFIPYDPTKPIFGPADVFGGSWQGTPIAVWNPYNNTWVVVYGHQTMAWRPRTFINFVSPEGVYSGAPPAFFLSPFGGTNRTGYDILGGLILDHVTKRVVYVARNETPVGTFNIEIMVFPAEKPGPVLAEDIIRHYIDVGGRGPEPSMFNTTFTRFLLWPTIYTSLLGAGRYVLIVYNDTSTSLAYAIVDLSPTPPSIVRRDRLVDRGVPTTYYPWIASSPSNWLVAWSGVGWANLSLIDTTGVVRSFVLADYNASFIRAIFDPNSGKYIIPYAITDETGNRNVFVAFYDTNTHVLEPWILPVATIKGQHETPLHVAVLSGPQPGSPGRIAIVALEGGSLVVYLISETYPELQTPIPIPEPWFIAVAVFVVALVASYFVILRRKVSL